MYFGLLMCLVSHLLQRVQLYIGLILVLHKNIHWKVSHKLHCRNQYGVLTLSRRRPLSYRNQCIDLRIKSMDWFLYENSLCHKRVKNILQIVTNAFLGNVCLSFLINEITLLTLPKTVSICILKFRFSSRYIPRCFGVKLFRLVYH